MDLRKHDKIFRYLFLFLVIAFFSFCYTCFFLYVTGDEMWNYGFAYNILNGLIPYRDFNMIVTPLYSFLGSGMIWLFGEYLYSFHILDAILVGVTMLMLFRMIGFRSFLVYPFILIWEIPSYNFLCLFWLFVILFLTHYNKDDDILVGVIIGLLFLTKQTVGFCLLIPFVFYSSSKKKAIISFLIPILLFLVYLIYNNALFQFIDYCFLGMFDFSKSNKIFSIFSFLELFLLIFLFIDFIKQRGRNKQLSYILAFQIIILPIMDFYHFCCVLPSVVYYFVRKCNSFKVCFVLGTIIFFFFICYLSVLLEKKPSFYSDESFMYMRVNYSDISSMDFHDKLDFILKYSDQKLFLFVRNAYLYKILMDEPINKYDLINNGNMGYHGAEKYILEIDNLCNKENCFFVIDTDLFDNKKESVQMNQEILEYVFNHYFFIDEYGSLRVYSNISY